MSLSNGQNLIWFDLMITAAILVKIFAITTAIYASSCLEKFPYPPALISSYLFSTCMIVRSSSAHCASPMNAVQYLQCFTTKLLAKDDAFAARGQRRPAAAYSEHQQNLNIKVRINYHVMIRFR